MATDETIRMSKRHGFLPISPTLGVDAIFNTISNRSDSVVTVCPVEREKGLPKVFYDKVKTLEVSSTLLSDTEIKTIIRNIANDLGLEDIEDDTPWRDAGLDSLSMVIIYIVFGLNARFI